MSKIETMIASFAKDPEVIMEALALLKVGRDKGDPTDRVMAIVIAGLLIRFHGLPLSPSELN